MEVGRVLWSAGLAAIVSVTMVDESELPRPNQTTVISRQGPLEETALLAPFLVTF